MTEQAEQALRDLTDKYVQAGFESRERFSFKLTDEQMQAFGNELRANDVIEPTQAGRGHGWRFTEIAFAELLDAIPLTPDASAVWMRLRNLYREQGHPRRGSFLFTPDAGEEIAMHELAIRGRIKRNFGGRVAPYCLTESGMPDLLRLA